LNADMASSQDSGDHVILQLPLCTLYHGKLSVLVMDNAKIHHGEGIVDLICETGSRLSHPSPQLTMFQVYDLSTCHHIHQT
jgi:hypothetical protein